MESLVRKAGLSEQIEVDSAGTAAYHAGEKADQRSRMAARERGVELRSVARKFIRADFERFDYVLAMDQDNFENLSELCDGPEALDKLFLLRSFDPKSPRGASVPDPYYGGEEGFREVFEICEAACRGLLQHIRDEHRLA